MTLLGMGLQQPNQNEYQMVIAWDREKKQTKTSQLNISSVCVAELKAHHVFVVPFTNSHSISIYRKLTRK
jgi:hypothetical protein